MKPFLKRRVFLGAAIQGVTNPF
jgi:hypothetical protein